MQNYLSKYLTEEDVEKMHKIILFNTRPMKLINSKYLQKERINISI